MSENTIVRTSGGSYEVRVGEGILSDSGRVIAEHVAPSNVALITDSTVEGLFADPVETSIGAEGIRTTRIVVPAGEASKSWSCAGDVLEQMASAGLGRGDAVVALGGGVIGDLAGYCASAYMRGIPVLQVPTTLLAQVDSSVGGKTAVDLAAGKNLAGAFWPPFCVLADTDTLSSLSPGQWADGLAEIVKTAFLDGDPFLSWIEANMPALLERDDSVVLETVRTCVASKAAVVASDEHESGPRESLNLGHTLGHAVERLEGYTGVSHGSAVAFGLDFAASLAERVCDVDPDWVERQKRLLQAARIPVPQRSYSAEDIVKTMHSDKKTRSGQVRFVLSTGPGDWVVTTVADDVLAETFEMWKSVGNG